MSADVEVIHGDCLETMRRMADSSVDAVVTDPPYDLKSGNGRGFMDKAWDGTGIAFRVELWKEVLRVLKPGGHVLAFGGTRTYHRMTCAIEDAGFEIRDSIACFGWQFHCLEWVTGQGFPKSLNLEGEWAGFGSALKPSHEPIVLARKPLDGTVARNVAEHGTGALNIDGCRVDGPTWARVDQERSCKVHGMKGRVVSGNGREREGSGRWPSNTVLLHHPLCRPCGTERVKSAVNGVESDGARREDRQQYRVANGTHYYGGRDGLEEVEAWECVQGLCPVAEMDRQSGELRSPLPYERSALRGRNLYDGGIRDGDAALNYGDSGGASMFFPTFAWEADDFAPFRYCAKASREERNAGLAGMPARKRSDDGYGSIQQPILDRACPRENWEPHETANHHPTVKPVSLIQWLTRLITPPGGLILDCFLGSGTTGVAAIREGFRLIGIEDEAEYVAIAEARIAEASRRLERPHAPVVKVNGHKRPSKAMPLFDLLDEGTEP